MANHDYVIANQGFPAFRSDLNDVLQAIVSNNSNATAPSTTYAYQMWYETDTNNWYMRNADNDAWITLATFNQTNDTVNFIDSSSTVAGISTSASATVITLSNGVVAINPAGYVSVGGAATQSGEIRFLEDTDSGSNYIALKPAAAIGSNSTLTLPEATDTLVGKATTDTLTNKTLTSPKINEDVVVTSTATELNKLDALSRGSIIYGNASAATAVLTKGSANTVLTSDGTDISWAAASGGGTSWQSSIVTGSTKTVVAGEGYWINTTSNSCTITLPSSPSVGDTIILVDYARTWGTNSITFNLNSEKFQGNTSPLPVYNTNGQSVTLVYTGSAAGWIPIVDDAVTMETPQAYAVTYLVVGGGGAGGSDSNGANNSAGGGGGAGGLRSGSVTLSAGVSITATVGAGGSGTAQATGASGSASSIAGSGFTTVTSAGGGGGAREAGDGSAGGSGGGGGIGNDGPTGAGGSGNSPSVSPSQGNNGGGAESNSPTASAGGGGGAGETGSTDGGGFGGDGTQSSITGSATFYAGGGAGGTNGSGSAKPGGDGGGAGGNAGGGTPAQTGTDGLGGGGGGRGGAAPNIQAGGEGGDGVVILSVPTDSYSGTTSGSPTVSTSGSNTIIKFTSSGTYTT